MRKTNSMSYKEAKMLLDQEFSKVLKLVEARDIVFQYVYKKTMQRLKKKGLTKKVDKVAAEETRAYGYEVESTAFGYFMNPADYERCWGWLDRGESCPGREAMCKK